MHVLDIRMFYTGIPIIITMRFKSEFINSLKHSTLSTQDGWMQIFRNFEQYAEEDSFTYACACIFFIITILTAAFIIANLIVAVVTTNLDKAMREMKVLLLLTLKTQ